jgi:hypothetical protein
LLVRTSAGTLWELAGTPGAAAETFLFLLGGLTPCRIDHW